MRRATHHGQERVFRDVISIHALHEESDKHASLLLAALDDFNPRSP